MYKHLTPQEIEEFEKKLCAVDGNPNIKFCITPRDTAILSFIDTLIGKRVGEIRDKIERRIEDETFFASKDPMTNGCINGLQEVARSILSPDSPKRNEEHDHPSQ